MTGDMQRWVMDDMKLVRKYEDKYQKYIYNDFERDCIKYVSQSFGLILLEDRSKRGREVEKTLLAIQNDHIFIHCKPILE